MSRATAASRNATSAGDRNMNFSALAGACPACCAAAAAGMAAPSALTDFRKRRRPSDSSMPPPQDVHDCGKPTPESSPSANELQNFPTERLVRGIELIDHGEMVVLLHAREARTGAVPLAERGKQERALRVQIGVVVLRDEIGRAHV